jgi:hypothetical protein
VIVCFPCTQFNAGHFQQMQIPSADVGRVEDWRAEEIRDLLLNIESCDDISAITARHGAT